MKNSKRILSVKIKRIFDDSPDTSYLGEYANRPTTEFSIDRAHSEDCFAIEANHRDVVDKLDRIREYVQDLYNLNLGTFNGLLGDSPAHREAESLNDTLDILSSLQDEAMECDCGERGDMQRHEYRYFNPATVEPFKPDASWIPANIMEPKEREAYWRKAMRSNAKQDYERIEGLQAERWYYIGIRADAEILLASNTSMSASERAQTCSFITQHITSGGLRGIESDSAKSYFAEVEAEELAGLRSELKALGFSARAISSAFKNVEHVEE